MQPRAPSRILCQTCGYDLRGLVVQRCPECGATAQPRACRNSRLQDWLLSGAMVAAACFLPWCWGIWNGSALVNRLEIAVVLVASTMFLLGVAFDFGPYAPLVAIIIALAATWYGSFGWTRRIVICVMLLAQSLVAAFLALAISGITG